MNGQGKDTLVGIESVAGSDFNDQLLGDNGALNVLFGEFGDDLLDGRGGFDSLTAAKGPIPV